MTLVNDTYSAECISNGTVLDACHQRFHVDASILPPRENTHSAQTNEPPPDSLKLKPPPREKQKEATPRQSQDQNIASSVKVGSSNSVAEDEQAPVSKPESHGDALDEFIQTVKATAELVSQPPFHDAEKS